MKLDLIERTAFFLLVLRIIEGLAAWILFNEVFFPKAPDAWPIHAVFIAYFVVNALLYFRHRDGRVTGVLTLVDICANVGTMALVAGCTGGLASPVVIILLFKIAAYAFVFSPHAGVVAIVLTVGALGSLVLGNEMSWWSLAPIDFLPMAIERQIDIGFRAFVLGVVLIAAPWLFNQVAEKEKQVETEAHRAREAARREHAAATVTGALLSMSEAVSRLTRLDEILNKVVDVAPRVLTVDYCGIFLWSEENGTYQGAAVTGVDPSLEDQVTSMQLRPADVPDLEWVRRLGHCAVMAPRGLGRMGAPEAPSLLTAPLLSGGRFYGVMQFARRRGTASFTQRDLTIADGVASQTAVALERARLIDESRRLVRAVESTQEGVLITDRHRRVVFANHALLQMFGYDLEHVLGVDALKLGADIGEAWLDEVQRAVVGYKWHGEAVARRQDGSTFPVALHVNLIRTEDNPIEGSVAIMEDISEKKELQSRMQRADRLAAAGEFAAGVAHEVNNALSGILGQADAVRHVTDAAVLRTAIARVETQGRRIADIVQGLLGFARPRAPERGPVDLRGLVRDTLALLAHDLGRARVRSETHFPADLPPILADAKQIQQVLVNLLTNATQAMAPRDGGTVTISAKVSPGMVTLDVQDSGEGIPADLLPRVFDPFFSTKAQGTGLGLSVSYAIVRTHGGELTARSVPNQGTTFSLSLPALVGATADVARTALLVDDDNDVAETLSAMLSVEGLKVRRAATGEEALSILAAEVFDVIFLDVRLPDISGQEVYRRLAAHTPELARRVIFVTGGLWRIDSRGLREQLPPQPTLGKPCTAAQIREVLRLLRDTRAAA